MLFFVFLIACTATGAHAQEKAWHNQGFDYWDSAKRLYYTHPDSSQYYQGLAREWVANHSDINLRLSILVDEWKFHYYKGDYQSVQRCLRNAKDSVHLVGYDELRDLLKVAIMVGESSLLKVEGKMEEALALELEMLEKARQLPDHAELLGVILINIGITYRNQGQYFQAIDHFLQAATLADSLRDYKSKFSALTCAAQVYMATKQYENAKKYLKDALQYMDAVDQPSFVAEAYSNLGNLSFHTKQYPEAIANFRKVLQIAQEMDNQYLIALAHGNMGETYLDKGDLDSAAHYLGLALPKFIGLDRAIEAFYVHNLQAQLALDRGQLGQALASLSKAKEIEGQIHIPEEVLVHHYQKFYTYYKNRKEYQQALDYYEKYMDIYERVASKDKLHGINELEYKYQTAEKERQLLEKENLIIGHELKSQRLQNWIIFGVFATVLSVGALFALIIRNKIKRKQERQALLEEQRKLTTSFQHQIISNQISPHFLFNSLNSIWNIFQHQSKEVAQGYMVSMTGLVRQTLQMRNNTLHPLGEELAFVESYLQLEKLRFGDKLTYKVEAQKGADLQKPIITMMIQQYVENALKHGLSAKPDDCYLEVSLRQDGQKMSVRVADNGVGMHKAATGKANGTGVGNKLFHDLINFYNNSNREKIEIISANLTADNRYPGTLMEIRIPNTYLFQLN